MNKVCCFFFYRCVGLKLFLELGVFVLECSFWESSMPLRLFMCPNPLGVSMKSFQTPTLKAFYDFFKMGFQTLQSHMYFSRVESINTENLHVFQLFACSGFPKIWTLFYSL